MGHPFEALMLPAPDGGQRFALHHPPAVGQARGAVLYLHPFAEEMNKVRRMAALQSRALAQAGFAVLQIDLLGCGDSSGELADARWSDWVDDALAGARWLCARHPDAPLWFWGARAGGLLAAAAAAQTSPTPGLLLWQPTPNGQTHLQQFLRIKSASQMLSGGTADAAASPKQLLAAGGMVEVAGYPLTAALAQGLAAARLLAPPAPGRIVWLEVSSREGASLSPAAEQWCAAAQAAGHRVDVQVLPGPAFWQTSEIEEAPALVQASVRALQAMSR